MCVIFSNFLSTIIIMLTQCLNRGTLTLRAIRASFVRLIICLDLDSDTDVTTDVDVDVLHTVAATPLGLVVFTTAAELSDPTGRSDCFCNSPIATESWMESVTTTLGSEISLDS